MMEYKDLTDREKIAFNDVDLNIFIKLNIEEIRNIINLFSLKYKTK